MLPEREFGQNAFFPGYGVFPAAAQKPMDIQERSGEVTFSVRVTPRAARDAIDGVFDDSRGGALKVRVSEPPIDGRANEAVRRLLAKRLNVRLSAVRIVAGEQSRTKRVSIAGVTPGQVRSIAKTNHAKGG